VRPAISLALRLCPWRWNTCPCVQIERPGARYHGQVLLDRLFENLDLKLHAFAVCEVASGWRLRLEKLDWVTVHFVLSGAGRLRVAGSQPLPLARHTLAMVPANRAHHMEVGDPVEHEMGAAAPSLTDGRLSSYRTPGSDDQELIVVCGRIQARYNGGPGLFDRLDEPLLVDFGDSPEMMAIFERLLAEQRQPSPASGVMMTALMSQALILLFRRLCGDPECPLPWLTAVEDPSLAVPLAMMLEHPERSYSLDTFADAAAMSRSGFVAAFGAHLGQSPMVYLRAVRMRRAASLLRASNLTIDQVAARVGYASRSQFSRAFRRHFGVSPAAFRTHPR
jgi:AraC-like DNA-binding protein